MAHNVHNVTSHNCKTPEKLFINRLCGKSENQTTGVPDFLTQANREEFGIQEGVPELERLTSEVHVPEICAGMNLN